MAEGVALGEIVTLQRGQSYKSAFLGEPGPVLLGLGTIERNGGFRGDNLRTYGGPTPRQILVYPGDLYLSLKDVTHTADLLGSVAMVPPGIEIGRLTQDTVRIEIKGNVDRRYLYWALRAPAYRRYCRVLGTGTTNLDLSRSDFFAFKVRLPAVEEQRAIAEVLGALDDKIAANTRLSHAGFGLARAYFRDLKRSDSSPVSLGELVSLEYGKSLPASRRNPGDVLVYGSGGVVGRHDVGLIDGPGVVVGRKGTAGAVHWAPGPHYPIDTTFFVVPREDWISPQFSYFMLSSIGLHELNSDSAVPGLNRAEAERTPVLLPTRQMVERFTARVAPLMAIGECAEQESRTLAATRDALLPALMSGKLRVRDAERTVEAIL